MCELRAIGTELVATPLVPTPPIAAVRARANRYVAVRRRRNALVASILIGLTVTSITKLTLTSNVDAVRLVGDPGGPHAPETTTTTAPTVPLPALDAQTPFLPSSGQDFNGDWGSVRGRSMGCPPRVDPKLPTIKVVVGFVSPTTVLGEPSPGDAVDRLVERFNHTSSICGRAVELVRDIEYTNIPGDAVAVLGLPLDTNLDAAIAGGRLDLKGIPVVGGDGLSAVQHSSPVVYPVGTSAAALARIAAQRAVEQGGRTYAVVHDRNRPFGVEAAAAFRDYVRRGGGTVKADISLDSSDARERGASEEFGRACVNRACDVVFLAMLPETAATWLAANPHEPRLGTAALPTLLTSGFADACAATSNGRCNGITAWTGFIPPFGRHASNLEALDAWTASWTDPNRGSAMVEAAVVSTRVLLEALLDAGPHVTRAKLRRTLDNMVFVSQVTSPLRWPSTGPRIGNGTAQAWQLVVGMAQAPPAMKASADPDKSPDEAQEQATRESDENFRALDAWLRGVLPKREWREVGTGWRTDPQ